MAKDMMKEMMNVRGDRNTGGSGGSSDKTGKAGYPKAGSRGMTKFEGPGSDAFKGDFGGPGASKNCGGDCG